MEQLSSIGITAILVADGARCDPFGRGHCRRPHVALDWYSYLRGNESRVLSAASFSRIDIGLSGEEIGRLVVWAARPGGRAGGGRGGRGTGGGTQTRGSLRTLHTKVTTSYGTLVGRVATRKNNGFSST